METKIASKLYGYAQTLYDPGFSYFEVEVPKDKSIDSAKHVLLTAMDDLGTMNFTEEDLTRAKNIILKSIENNVSQTTDFAVSLTEYIGAGDWRLFLYRDRIEKLTVADIQAAAKNIINRQTEPMAFLYRMQHLIEPSWPKLRILLNS